MPELEITDEKERSLVLSALISHAFRCRESIKLHNETKDALKENAIGLTAQKATDEMHAALTMMVLRRTFEQFKILLLELRAG